MKKLITLVIIASLSIFYARAQGVFVHNANIINGLKTGELNVVMPDNKYGEELKEAITKYWTATKYKFITAKELEAFEDKKKINLLGYFSGNIVAHSYTLSNIPFLAITNTYKVKNKYEYKKKNLLAHVMLPLDNIADENLKSIITLNVKTLNYLVKTGGYKTWHPAMQGLKAKVKRKEVLICKDDLKATLPEIKKIYSGKIKVVEKEEYDKAILGEEEVLLLTSLKDKSMYSYLTITSNKGVVYYADLNHSAASKNWDKEFLIRFFKNLK